MTEVQAQLLTCELTREDAEVALMDAFASFSVSEDASEAVDTILDIAGAAAVPFFARLALTGPHVDDHAHAARALRALCRGRAFPAYEERVPREPLRSHGGMWVSDHHVLIGVNGEAYRTAKSLLARRVSPALLEHGANELGEAAAVVAEYANTARVESTDAAAVAAALEVAHANDAQRLRAHCEAALCGMAAKWRVRIPARTPAPYLAAVNRYY